MRGLVAVLARPGTPRVTETLERMLTALALPGYRTSRLVLSELGVAFGHSAPGLPGQQQPGTAESGQVHVLVEGEPLEYRALAASLGLPASTRPADAIAALYAAKQTEGLKQLRGHWSLAIADSHRKAVVIANDAFGARPLFRLYAGDDVWLIASHPAALLAYNAATRTVDPAGLADYLAFGHTLGVKTLFRGVELLPAATLLTWTNGILQPDGIGCRRPGRLGCLTNRISKAFDQLSTRA